MHDLMPPINTPDSTFHDGDPTTGQLDTIVTALWLNNLQSATRDTQLEIKNVLAKAGIQPEPKKTDQLAEAISQIIGSGNYASTAYVDNGLNKKVDKVSISQQLANDVNKVPSLDLVTKELGNKQPKGNYQPTGNYALVGTSYTKAESDGRYQSKGSYATAGSSYAKAESDGRYQGKGNYQPAGNYAIKGDSYTKAESDNKYFDAHTNVLSVDLNSLGASSHAGIYYQHANAGATGAYHYPISEAGSLLVTQSAYGCQQEYTAFSSGRKFVRGLTTSWNGKDGPWGAWTEYSRLGVSYSKSESDGKYQPKGNYAPAGNYGAKNTANKAQSGWWKCASTGVIIQWGNTGNISRDGNKVITFPLAFPTICVSVTAVAARRNGDQFNNGISVESLTKTTCNFVHQSYDNSYHWMAIGY